MIVGKKTVLFLSVYLAYKEDNSEKESKTIKQSKIKQISTKQISLFVKGLRSDLQIPALQVANAAKSFQEVVDFVIEVERVKPDDFTTTSTSKRLRKGGEFNGSYTRGQGSESYSVRPIQSSLQTVVGGPPPIGQHFSERPMHEPRECYGCGEI